MVGIKLAIKGIKSGSNNIVRRTWKNFDSNGCLQKIRNMDWKEILESQDVNVANSLFEEKLGGIMDECAPMKTVQVRSRYNNWIREDTKKEMRMRDAARVTARNTDLDEDWEEFKRLRNSCTVKQRNDKKHHLKAVYSGIEEERDTSKLFCYYQKNCWAGNS